MVHRLSNADAKSTPYPTYQAKVNSQNRTDYLNLRAARKRGAPMQQVRWQVNRLATARGVALRAENERSPINDYAQVKQQIPCEATLSGPENVTEPTVQRERWNMLYDDISVTLKQTWRQEEPIAAMCVQYVDVQCVCNSH